MCQCLGIFLFNFVLLLFTLPVYLVALLGRCFSCFCCGSCRDCYERGLAKVVKTMASLSWRLTLYVCCCWIRVSVEGFELITESRALQASTGRPVVYVSNHLSFIDTVLAVAFFPICHVGEVKMIVSEHLLKMPALGTITTAMGHLAIPFKSQKAGEFILDQDEKEKVMNAFEDHLVQGNICAWFPEGTTNKGDPTQAQIFRAGGFSMVTRNDVEILAGVFVGNPVCWPNTAPVGGRPANITFRVIQICESSQDLLAENNLANASEKDRNIFLANYSQRRVQKELDRIVSEGWASTGKEAFESAHCSSDEAESSPVLSRQ